MPSHAAPPAGEFVTRFAPSPTGPLHLGHAYSALLCFEAAQHRHGRFLLRIEDIDRARCRPEFIDLIFEDLDWLGLSWEKPVRRQADFMADYARAIDHLKGLGVLYPCYCTRADIKKHPETRPGPLGAIYPGTCRDLAGAGRGNSGQAEGRQADAGRADAGRKPAWRLDAARAGAIAGPLSWHEEGEGDVPVDPTRHGDVVIVRKDTPASYHLAVTVDDALQGVSHIIRGMDLYETTHIHRLLQALLDLPSPHYRHHRLLMEADGAKKLSKSKGSVSLKDLREQGWTADDVRAEIRRLAGPGCGV